MSLVGKKSQVLKLTLSLKWRQHENQHFEEATKKQQSFIILVSKDFTFVPTELHAFQAALPEFNQRNTIVIGASCDTNEVHFAWLNTPKNNGGIELPTLFLLIQTETYLIF
jgi:peroxiredoxin (alkyl hydroperoxide reductase subunit C)